MVLLAAKTSELMRRESGEYSPLLLPHQPAARIVAARTLHELFGAKMLPWLISGPPRSLADVCRHWQRLLSAAERLDLSAQWHHWL